MVGGIISFFTASADIIASTAPLAPNICPVIDFVELTASLYACSPNAFFIALVSPLSLSFVLVPCALI